MEDVKNLLVCPECKCGLSEALVCKRCGNHYGYRYGVFDLVSQKLSGDQQTLWKITDDMIENEIEAQKQENIETDWIQDYRSHKNRATVEAENKWNAYMDRLLENLSGVVCDLATGRGGMLQKLLDTKNKNFRIICTDIDKRILAWTRKLRKTDDRRVAYVATDGRYLSFKDEGVDYVTSLAAFGNIPESDKVAKELYRVLKPGGKLIIQGSYIEPGSKSFEIAKSRGFERGLVEKYLIEELRNAGFEKVRSTVVAEAEWAENPYDLIPAAGDKQRYGIIQAQRIK